MAGDNSWLIELLDKEPGIFYNQPTRRNPEDESTMPPATPTDKPDRKPLPAKLPEILDVGMAAAFLTVSRDTVYRLFQSGQLPGRKVGRKWVTTKAAVIRWLEHSSTHDALARAVESGDREALHKAIKDGKVRVKSG